MIKILLIRLIMVAIPVLLSTPANAIDTGQMDIYSGHFSREGNNQTPSKATNNSIYIKLLPKNRIATLYIPFPYSKKVTPDMINKVFEYATERITDNSYTRSTFDVLEKNAILHMETWSEVRGQLQFECGGMSPCAIRFNDDHIELIKSGVVNEHIIKFNHVTGNQKP